MTYVYHMFMLIHSFLPSTSTIVRGRSRRQGSPLNLVFKGGKQVQHGQGRGQSIPLCSPVSVSSVHLGLPLKDPEGRSWCVVPGHVVKRNQFALFQLRSGSCHPTSMVTILHT